MAGNLSDYLENKLLDHFLGTTTFTKPTTVYVGLYTVAPTDAGGGTQVTGGSYARQTATFSAAASGTTSNTANIDFAGMPAATTVAIGVFDALTSGNLLLWGTLTANKTTDAGDTLRIATGDLDISID
ncbi:hypothetical protein UFOVP573_129 [uncultured Caudovirales phage]|uniref:Uncharacterized protein n=1 Tax=uncultured Caudovirales phage TaxID=2100421 RepID=A0A6J5LS39_9CAUD|nr:hypothetical protein UFOVP288_143 [uncultured Caudovirales phage]CAB4146091.1 hypothetical protein UFOVP483_53 [uncultured Caudovirales phage]CAB4151054.1 hypothetical protein UFOVP573_129 [uncultured Caudovirales phage]CAB4161629.1 hypothetical protein UFOVP769_143 [uncultured Caudovirales phage]CAB4175037.1 hypothetical protein UFOVP962_111 [uncultured Caudovirales phage]